MEFFIILSLVILGVLFSNSFSNNELEKQSIKRLKNENMQLILDIDRLKKEAEECEQFWKDFDPKMLERIIKHAEEYNRTKSNK